MANMFFDEPHSVFKWSKLGDINAGRGNLGEEMPVLVYRMMEYSMNDVLTRELGEERAHDIFRSSGYLAGIEFANNVLELSLDLNEFTAALQQELKKLKIGILRIEKFDRNTGEFILTIAEDLDCSGLPPTNEVVCTFDEGFLSGIMEQYTGRRYEVREIDCWASGERVCRFRGKAVNGED